MEPWMLIVVTIILIVPVFRRESAVKTGILKKDPCSYDK